MPDGLPPREIVPVRRAGRLTEVDVTAEAVAGLAADFANLPVWVLGEDQLADLEMLVSGAFAPLAGFMSAGDVASVCERGRLADGTPWPVPVVLDVADGVLGAGGRRLVLADHDAVPLAVLDVTERSPALALPDGRAARHARPAGAAATGLVRLSGPVRLFREFDHGPFRRLRRRPADTRRDLGDGPVLAFVTRRPVHSRQIGQLRHVAGQLRARLLLLPLVAGPAGEAGRPGTLVRAVSAAVRHLPPGTVMVPVPLAGDAGPGRQMALHARVAATYGATHLLADVPAGGAEATAAEAAGAVPTAVPVMPAGDWAYDRSAEVWRPLSLIEPGMELADLTAGEVEDLLDRGEEPPLWFTPAAVAAELRRARPPRSRRGLTVFLTGLPGSGKSTIARDLRDALSERGDRTASLLDGDLAAGLLPAAAAAPDADGDANVSRIGLVATEIARHGGIAICAAVAPHASGRAAVRRMSRETGDFVMIHVSTPAGVCGARERQCRQARRRAGLAGRSTGAFGAYEEPRDADLVIDTSEISRQEALEAVLGTLTVGGWLAAGDSGR